MLLSDRDIRSEIQSGRVKVEPFVVGMIQPSSVDVRLDRFFRVFENHKYSVIDPSIEQSELTREVAVAPDEHFILHPGEFVLASTYEVITLPDDIAGRLDCDVAALGQRKNALASGRGHCRCVDGYIALAKMLRIHTEPRVDRTGRVDRNVTRSCLDENTGYRAFAPTCSVVIISDHKLVLRL